jgi:hypothetical protein
MLRLPSSFGEKTWTTKKVIFKAWGHLFVIFGHCSGFGYMCTLGHREEVVSADHVFLFEWDIFHIAFRSWGFSTCVRQAYRCSNLCFSLFIASCLMYIGQVAVVCQWQAFCHLRHWHASFISSLYQDTIIWDLGTEHGRDIERSRFRCQRNISHV